MVASKILPSEQHLEQLDAPNEAVRRLGLDPEVSPYECQGCDPADTALHGLERGAPDRARDAKARLPPFLQAIERRQSAFVEQVRDEEALLHMRRKCVLGQGRRGLQRR